MTAINKKNPTKLNTFVSWLNRLESLSNLNFGSLEPYVFPIVPKSLDSFLLYLFVHSLVLTSSTPLARVIRGRWMAVGSVHTAIIMIPGLEVFKSNATTYGDATVLYADEAESPGIDRAFGLHAFFALLWLFSSYLQMGPIRTLSVALHRAFGYIALTSFLCHMLAAINSLVFDEAKHQPISKVALGSIAFMSMTYMILAIKAAKKHDTRAHVDYAIRSYLYSIEGAGTIRTVAYLQALLSHWLPDILQGPMHCQNSHAGLASHCAVEYTVRLLLTRLLTLYYLCLYVKIKGRSKYVTLLAKEVVMASVCCLAFLSVMAAKETLF